MSLISESSLIFVRQMRLSLRSPAWPIIGLFQPALYLAFLGPLLVSVAGARSTACRPGRRGGSSCPAC